MRAWLELVRAPAALSVPGDTLAGAAAAGRAARPGLAAASVLLYWAGMALNDWSDRDLDAVERPERPIPSGRISPAGALGVAVALTGAGVAAAGIFGGRRGLALAGLLAGSVWAYDIKLKHTPAGPAAMAACRVFDVLLGAGPATRAAAPMALAVGAHTYGITLLGTAEVDGAEPSTIVGAMAATGATAALAAVACLGGKSGGGTAERLGAAGLIAGYLATAGRAQVALCTDPDPQHVRQAVRMSILGLIPLQAAAVAGRGRLVQAAALLAALPAGRWLSAKVATS
ncbi:SCO3242 family prenyltransferase [Microbispora triticiradicis]|uniref:4-hydroxybenzoate polyprenyltransferase n=2 Tax=Microbispora TaxID=2005 RepID=A0ABY3LTH0_9ACTN|nr:MULTISPECIES: UbiA family prenyltransferase [Microbispora]TLP63759.1 4-hydroxybenzoate polyprenyltransferase [Microbispora fusca]TYB52559.1 4-hydroxybenzoate polyprenyltransferase [Microbispora tritici]